MISNIKKPAQIKKKYIIFNNIIQRSKDEPYKEYYFVEDFIYDDDDNYDLFLQKCWGNYKIIQRSEYNFQYKRFSALEPTDDEYDKILQILENSDIKKEEQDEVILRTKKNAGGNSFKSQYKNKWIPLKLSEHVTIEYGQRVELPLGITIRVPKKYEAWVYLFDSMYENFGIIQEAPLILDNEHSDLDDWKLPVIMINPNFVKYVAVNSYATRQDNISTVDDTTVERFNVPVTIPAGTIVAKMRLVELDINIIIKDQVTTETIDDDEFLHLLEEIDEVQDVEEVDEDDPDAGNPLTAEDEAELLALESIGYDSENNRIPDDEGVDEDEEVEED